MSREAVEQFYRAARQRAAAGEAWDAICTTVYADVLAISHTMTGDPEAALDGQVLAATPVPEGGSGSGSAQALVDRMRAILVGSIPEGFRADAEAMFEDTAFLADLAVPTTARELADLLSRTTGGLRVHDFKRSKSTDARVHATAARMMVEQEVDDVDIAAARRESDRAVFEAASTQFAIDHADWSLEGHRARLAAAETASAGIGLESHEEYRRTALRQFEGLAEAPAVNWLYRVP